MKHPRTKPRINKKSPPVKHCPVTIRFSPMTKREKTATASPMPNPAILAVRYKAFVLQKYKQAYIDSPDRDAFIEAVKAPLMDFLLDVVTDPYQREINSIWRQGFHLKKKLADTLQQLEKVRHYYYQQQWFGMQYNQPYEPVDDFVEVTEPKTIIRFLIRCGVANYFHNVIMQLEQARKRGGLHEREELSILRKVAENTPLPSLENRNQIGFKWVGDCREKRINSLYINLLNRGYLHKQTSPEQFAIIFSETPVEKPVVWLKTLVQLLYLTDRLLDTELLLMPEDLETMRKKKKHLLVLKNRNQLDEKQNAELKQIQHRISVWQYERMQACFLDKQGKELSGKKLKHTRNDLDNKNVIPKTANEIESIITKLLSITRP